MERVLLTGGAGYIGSILAKALLDDGFEVVVLDNFKYRQNSLLDCCPNENFSVIRGDVRDEETLSKALDKADIIIHLAALVGAPLCDADPIAAKTTNLEATKLLLSLRSPSQKLLYPCTNSGYGIGQKDKFCTEETPLRPISLYGRTKVDAEQEIIRSGNFISYRLATVFGVSPRMRLDLLVNDFVYRAVNDHYLVIFEGKFKRNYIHINDVARVFLHGIKNFESLKNQVYNVGISEANLSKIELCEKVKEHIPNFVYVESAIREDPDKRDYLISNEKIEKTGFRPKFSIDDGIIHLIKAYEVLKSRVYSNI